MVITNETLELHVGNNMWFWDFGIRLSKDRYGIMFDVNNLKTDSDGRKI